MFVSSVQSILAQILQLDLINCLSVKIWNMKERKLINVILQN